MILPVGSVGSSGCLHLTAAGSNTVMSTGTHLPAGQAGWHRGHTCRTQSRFLWGTSNWAVLCTPQCQSGDT